MKDYVADSVAESVADGRRTGTDDAQSCSVFESGMNVENGPLSFFFYF